MTRKRDNPRHLIRFVLCAEVDGEQQPITGPLPYAEASAAHTHHRQPGENLPRDRQGRRLSLVVLHLIETEPIGQLSLL